MMRFEATYCATLQVVPDYEGEKFDRDEVLEDAIDKLSEELLSLVVIDPIIDGSLTTGDISVTVTCKAESPVEALRAIDSAVRSAFHAAEVHTANWPQVRASGLTFRQLAPALDDEIEEEDHDGFSLIGA